jgi:hypothetical protein
MGRGRRWRALAGLAEPQINACDLDLLIALNSGLPGMCTLHANSAREALVKMCTLPLLAGENVAAALVVVAPHSSGRNRTFRAKQHLRSRQAHQMATRCPSSRRLASRTSGAVMATCTTGSHLMRRHLAQGAGGRCVPLFGSGPYPVPWQAGQTSKLLINHRATA